MASRCHSWGFITPAGIVIADGHCRLEAARILGLQEIPVIIFDHRPDEAELLATQLSIGIHRSALNPVDEYEAFARLAKLKGWNASQLATHLTVSNSEITRVQAIGKLTPEERQLVRTGKISKSSAYALTRMTPERRTNFAAKAAAGEVSRDELQEQARRKPANPTVKTARISLHQDGNLVTITTPDGIHLGGVIELLESLLKQGKKARSQGLDISTLVRMLRDRSRAQPSS